MKNNNRREFIQKVLILGALSVIPFKLPEVKKFYHIFTKAKSHKIGKTNYIYFSDDNNKYIIIKEIGTTFCCVTEIEGKYRYIWKKLKNYKITYNLNWPKVGGLGEMKVLDLTKI